jgi:hypothetical protein
MPLRHGRWQPLRKAVKGSKVKRCKRSRSIDGFTLSVVLPPTSKAASPFYGDIVRLHQYARSLANVEAIIGQIYPATLLARS